MEKSKDGIFTETNLESRSLIIEFYDKGTRHDSISVFLSELSPAMIDQAALHGLKQKICDAAAIGRDPETGQSATIARKFAASREVFERITGGLWNKQAAGGGNNGGILLRALYRLYEGKKDLETLRAFLADKTTQEKNALKLNKRIAPIIEAILLEGNSEDIDSDSMLDELE